MDHSEWLKIQWLWFKSEKSFTQIKYSNDENVNFLEVDISKSSGSKSLATVDPELLIRMLEPLMLVNLKISRSWDIDEEFGDEEF